MKYRVEQILEIKEKLATLPEVPLERQEFVNARDAVSLLADVIRQLQKKGYSTEQIATLLRDQGLQLSLFTLRQYVVHAGGKGPSKRQTAKDKKAAPNTATKSTRTVATKQVTVPETSPKGGFAVRGDTEEL